MHSKIICKNENVFQGVVESFLQECSIIASLWQYFEEWQQKGIHILSRAYCLLGHCTIPYLGHRFLTIHHTCQQNLSLTIIPWQSKESNAAVTEIGRAVKVFLSSSAVGRERADLGDGRNKNGQGWHCSMCDMYYDSVVLFFSTCTFKTQSSEPCWNKTMAKYRNSLLSHPYLLPENKIKQWKMLLW